MAPACPRYTACWSKRTQRVGSFERSYTGQSSGTWNRSPPYCTPLNPLKSFEAPELSAVEADVVAVGAVVDVLVLEGTAEDDEGLSLRVETRADGPPHALEDKPGSKRDRARK